MAMSINHTTLPSCGEKTHCAKVLRPVIAPWQLIMQQNIQGDKMIYIHRKMIVCAVFCRIPHQLKYIAEGDLS